MGAAVKRSLVVVLLLAIFAAEAAATGKAIFYNLAYSFAGLLALSYVWAWYNVARVSLQRVSQSAQAQVGKVAEERFLLHNRGPLPALWLQVEDHSDLPDHHASVVINSLGARKQRGWTVRTVCRRRGRYRLGPLALVSGDPFGLFVRRRELKLETSIVVYPLAVDLPSFGALMGELSGGGPLHKRTHYVTTNVAGVRDYYPGDSFNRIHWPSTARTGRLIVKEFELDPTADIWLFADMEGAVQAERPPEEAAGTRSDLPLLPPRPLTALEPTTEEYVVAVTATLSKYFLERNRAVGLLAYSQRLEMLQPDRGERHLNRILEILAVIRARGNVSIAQLLATTGASFSRHSTAIVITPSVSTGWVEVLRDLGRRGVLGMAVVVDPRSFGSVRDATAALQALAESGIPAYRVREGDSLALALAAPVSL